MLEKLLELSKDREVSYYHDRILAELKYAYTLSQKKSGIYDELIEEVETFLYKDYEKFGAITGQAVFKAEKLMNSLNSEAKSFKAICAAHAHIDMNWMWGFDETVCVVLDTFRTMLDIMKEYPEFKFSQSQASVYKIVEEHDPEMLEEIKLRVKEGRWEITASTWVENDKNMPNGESLSRQILYAKKYLSELFNIDPEGLNIDFEPDTFGHSLNLPEILSQGGVKYYYHCRGYEGEHNLYKWISPSGAELIVNWETNWYNATIDSSMAPYIPDLAEKNGMKTVLKVYGVGDHGGGPTRRDIERILDMNTWPIFPQITFGTFGEYFRLAENIKDILPIVRGEQNFLCDGCYTTQTKIKEGNRMSESLLNEAELFSSFAALSTGSHYPNKDFEEAWRNVLFNQFHDILPGSGVPETREYAVGQYQKVKAMGLSKRKIALKKITDKIDTLSLVPKDENIKNSISEGAGVGFGQCERGTGKTRIFHIFNSSMTERKEITNITVWDWDGDIDRILFKNEKGQEVSSQVVKNGFNDYWGHKYLNIMVETQVPTCGYSTYTLTEDSIKAIKIPYFIEMRKQRADEFVLENSLIKVVFSPLDGSIISIIDKATKKESIDNKRKSGIFRIVDEADSKGVTNFNPGMSAWFTGRYKNIESANTNVEMKIIKGPLKNSIIYETQFRNSKLNVIVSLEEGKSLINYEVKCDWQEIGIKDKIIPQLQFYMPLAYECENYKYDIPFGVINRASMDMDLPGNSFVVAKGTNSEAEDKKEFMLITGSKYGFRGNDDAMIITLIRSSYEPDPYPEFGIHNFNFSMSIMESSKSNNELINYAYDYNHPLNVLSGSRHGGEFPLQKQFMSLEGSAIVSAIKMTEDEKNNSILIRIYETEGVKTENVLNFFKIPETAYLVDINENKIDQSETKIIIEENKVCFDILPYKLLSIVVKF